ncbi:MAG: methyltransferase domain-containing protein, partial [Clostridiales bacterium]|nr:methyltransferase domain-containing protein [Clostridiales bacterium]
GIEERLAPYADLILRGEEAAPAVMAGPPESPESPGPDQRSGTTQAAGSLVQQETQATQELPDASYPLRWYDRPSPRYALPEGYERVYAELGCGRGRFINGMAAADPGALYIGAEGCKTILIRALAETRAAGRQNTRYIDSFVNDAASAFAESSLDGIFLNFSDPWPKIRHAGRRLTAPAKAEAYFKVLKPGGFIVLKTDGEDFFDYSLTVFMVSGFDIAYKTRELQCREGLPCPGSPYDDYGASCFQGDYDIDVAADDAVDAAADAAVTALNKAAGITAVYDRPGSALCPVAERGAGMQTEYEKKFRADGFPIYCLIAIKQ